jgi:GGDEF domain-containing protein
MEEVKQLLASSDTVATYPLDGTTSKELIERADAAMYAAKQAGRTGSACPTTRERLLCRS